MRLKVLHVKLDVLTTRQANPCRRGARQKAIRPKHAIILAGTLLLAVAAGLSGCQQANGTSSEEFTGFLQGERMDIAPEVGGRITTILVEEGDTVESGQKLVTIQDDLVRLRLAAADANVEAAQAQLALLEAGTRAEELKRAEARVTQARAALAAAEQALADAASIRAKPQALLIAKAAAESRARAASLQLTAAVLQAQAADEMYRFWEQQTRQLWDGFDIVLPRGAGTLHFDTPGKQQVYAQEEWTKAGQAAWQSWAGVAQAQANATMAEASLKDVSDQINNPIALDMRVNQARAAKERAAAGLETAEAALLTLREGASPAQIQTARAALDQARAARATLEKELARYQLAAPNKGTISRVYYRAGEIVPPGAPFAELQIESDLTLRVFVPMTALERVRVGMSVPVQIEGTEERTLTGTVSRIGERAEFTGREAQTDDERNAQLVAVDIVLKHPDTALKSGMPATTGLK